MIQRIQQSRTFKVVSVYLVLNILAEILAPMRAFALTGGPAQPEFSSFTPVGTSDMVDLASGDMNYSIPLMDVGGYPLTLAYASGVGMDDEASWVGLGWNLSVGQINRNVRGLPDDFQGDDMTYENHMKPNVTVGANFKFTPNVFGSAVDADALHEGQYNDSAGMISYGVAAMYNNYNGFSMKPSVGIQLQLGNYASVGFNAESGADGLSLDPSFSIHGKSKAVGKRTTQMGANFGVSMNSRQGLTSMALNVFRHAKTQVDRTKNQVTSRSQVQGGQSVGSSISFTDNLYTPDKRVAMTTKTFTVNAALGSEVFGGEGQGQITAYGVIQSVDPAEHEKHVGGYGYQNTEKAGRANVLDFNREKDGAFSTNSTNLAVTNYTYDIYSVQGQGVSGMYRPYRNQVGYVYDASVQDNSVSGTLGLEFGVGNAAHNGADFESSNTSSHSGVWENDNFILQYLVEHFGYNPRYEKVHFKNAGDLSTDEDFQLFDQVGAYQPVRVPFIGSTFDRKAASQLNYKYNGAGSENALAVGNLIRRTQRQARNQAVTNVTVDEVRKGVGYGPCVWRSSTAPAAYAQLPAGAKPYHTAEVQVVRNDGARYVYGYPLYNTIKREASFSVHDYNAGCGSQLVTYSPGVDNSASNSINDENFNRVTTPAYAHTYLLTSILSTDYQDLTNDGPSDDDLGGYTKFNYVNKLGGLYRWRVPYQQNTATYNAGLNTDLKDDQGNYVYGEKQQLYPDKIETKTHVAVFYTSARKDANGVLGENGGLDTTQHSYKLDSIRLFSKAEYLASPTTAIPIKTANFVYSYSLCPGVPNNNILAALKPNELSNKGGKLTLKKVYFTYRNSRMGKYTGYKFHYNEYTGGSDELSGTGPFTLNAAENPSYNIKGYDTWGNYKPNTPTDACKNTAAVSAAEFPFTEQNKAKQDVRAAVWNMKSIDLPSGGNISIAYESDDYGSIQNKKALRMYKIAGAGRLDNPTLDTTAKSDVLFSTTIENLPNHYLYVEVPGTIPLAATDAQIKDLFFNDLPKGLIHFRFFVNTTQAGGSATTTAALDEAKFDYITGYIEPDIDARTSKVFDTGGKRYLSIPIKTVDREGGISPHKQVNPIAKAAWHFGRKYLSQHVYSNQPNGDTQDISALVSELLSVNVLKNIMEIFTGPNVRLENKLIGRTFIKDKSWIRLEETTGRKLGGGVRVKEIRMTDKWAGMNPVTGSTDMSYGQHYTYELENEPGKSSGVATYEPVGNKENPFVEPVYSTVKHLLAPDEDNYMELPFGESFFPNPQVTYARVSVSSLALGEAPSAGMQVKKRHRTGHVVTQFYTSKDYPTIVDQTKLQAEEDRNQVLDNLLKKFSRKHLTASQGYVIHLNDMNGKQRSQRVYAEGQDDAISGVDYNYDNYSSTVTDTKERNKGQLDNRVKVIYPNGAIRMKTLGVEYDIVHDFRENASQTTIQGINANLATFFVGIVPGLVPVPLPDMSVSEDQFRSVTTTKVINTFGILKEIVAYDVDAEVHTRNLAWDAVTGEVLVTETVDEYNDTYYSFNYPAHWYYKGMGQAAANLGITDMLQAVTGGYTMAHLNGSTAGDFLLPGDELVYGAANPTTGIRPRAWVSGIQGNTFTLIDKTGTAVTSATGEFTVVRSGHRNLQSAGIMNATLMRNPLKNEMGGDASSLDGFFLSAATWDTWKIVNAGAVDYSDNWPAGCECGLSASGTNPYVRNERGVWRTKSSQTYLTGRNTQAEVTPRREGFLVTFNPFYRLTEYGNWYKNTTGWTAVSKITVYSPYGFELENKDALKRYSGAQYGYNNRFPMAVGANTRYREMGFDGMEDHGFAGCTTNLHFSFRESTGGTVVNTRSHTGNYSIKVAPAGTATLTKQVTCTP